MLTNHVRPVMIQLILLIMIITSVSVYSISNETQHTLKLSIQDKLISLANVTAAHISGDSLDKIRPGEENSTSFLEIRNFLQISKISSEDINSIYTMRRNGTDIEFVVDADYGYIPDTPKIGDKYDVMQVYKNAEPEIMKGFLIPIADQDFTTDQWGTVLSGFSPIRNSNGTVVGIVGVDMNSSNVVSELNNLTVYLYILGLLTIIFSVVGIVLIEDRRLKSDLLLLESEKKYRHLFENAGDGILILSTDPNEPGRILAANDVVSLIHGYCPGELTGLNISRLTESADVVIIHNWISRIIQGEKFHVEGSHIKKDGTVFPVEISADLIDTGRGTYILDIIRDITGRKKAELVLEESEQRLRFALESIEAAQWDLNVLERTVFRSPDHDRLFGYVSNLPGWTYDTFLNHILPDDRIPVEEAFQTALNQKTKFSIECRILRNDGEIHWLRVSGQPHLDKDGNPDRLIGLLYDITSQKQAELVLKESQNFLDKILNSIKDPIFVKDHDHQWILINDAFSSFIGKSREDLIGRTDYDFFSSSEAELFWKFDDKVLDTGFDSENEEEIMDASGLLHTLITKKSRYTALSGESFLVGIIRDISERKRMEDDIRQSLREKEVLLHEVHHRVNNNLQIISSLISMQIRTVPDETIRQFMRETQSRIRSIALVYELLSLSENVEQIDLSLYIKKLFKSVFELYSVDRNHISVLVKDSQIVMPIIEAVPISLIIRELLANSVLYAFSDGRAGEIHVGIDFDPHTKIFTLAFDDNGVGIPGNIDLNSRKTLGMSLIYGLTRQLSGEIAIESKEGVHVRITFPLKIQNHYPKNSNQDI